MSDPIAQAAQQLNEPEKKEGVIGEVMGAIHALEEKVEHFIHPDALALAQNALEASQASGALADQVHQQGIAGSIDPTLVEQFNQAHQVAMSATLSLAELPNAATGAAAQPAMPLSVQGASTESLPDEHPHTPILRKIVGLLRRDFNMLPGELESWVKDAEKAL